MTDKSTDAEIVELMRDGNNCRYNDEADHIDFARAVLAKWGQPAQAAEPVAWEPMSHAQAKALVLKYGNDPLHLVYQVEAAHGIKGGQHGTE